MIADQENHAALSGEPSDTGALEPSGVQIGDMAGLARGIQEYIAKNLNVFGGADIYNL